MSTYHRRQRSALLNALDEARFGHHRTLNLRSSLPTVADAVARTEAWVRERQVTVGGEVLIITGRGRGSPGGVSAVREAVGRLLSQLRRRGVVAEFTDHSSGSFVAKLAPVGRLLEAPRRGRDRPPPPTRGTSRSLSELDPSTRELLHELASRSLIALGTTLPDHFVEDEMLRQFNVLAASVPPGRGSEDRLRRAIKRAMEELDDQ